MQKLASWTLVFCVGLLYSIDHASAQTYSVIDLGWNGSTPGGGAPHSAINRNGQVVGSGNYFAYGATHGYLYSNGVTTDIGSLGAYPTNANAINDNGQVVGSSNTISGATHAVLYNAGKMTDLGALPGSSGSAAFGINNQVQIVGSSSFGAVSRAFLYSSGQMTDLSPVLGGSSSSATSINNSGDVVGYLILANGLQHAFLYHDGTVTDLGNLIAGGNLNSSAVRINDPGQILIASDLGSFVYTSGQMTAIPPFLGGNPGNISPQGMNNLGQAVGDWTVCCPYDGFLYSGGTTTNLNIPALPVFVLAAWDINDGGQIPVWAGEEYLLTPSTGTIEVTTNLSSATFSINGSANYSGAGAWFPQPNASPGTYTITYNPVTGYTTPAPQTQTLASGRTIVFSATYSSVPTTGTITVNTNLSAATFTISGPATYSGGGMSLVQPNAPFGTYSIAYGPPSCASLPNPNPDTKPLTSAGLTFTGTYGGSLTVTVSPTAATAATFSISPPIAGFPTSAPSQLLRNGVPVGHYRITFNDLPGWNMPAPQDFDIGACLNTPVQGLYTPKIGTGTATMSVSVNNLGGAFTIISTNPAFPGPLTCPGSSPACIFNTLFSLSVPVGTYTVQFKDVPGTFTPLAQRVSLLSGQQFNTAGYYRRLFLIGFTGYNNAPSPSDCFNFATNQAFRGSGDQYGIAQLNQPGMGIGTAVLSALNNVQLKKAIQGTAFTFYETGNGDACTAPNDESDHGPAGDWIQQMAPTPDDWVVVVGHSYGGNRAQLFSKQINTALSRPVDLLVTIDPIRWTICHIQGVLFGSDDVQPCNQTFLSTPVSNARQVWAYYQTIGVPVPNLVHTSFALYGYIPLNALASKQIPVDHLDIDDDVTVQSSISNMLLTAVNGARVAASVNSLARTDGVVSLSWAMTLQPMLSVSGMTITSATLNGITAGNLSLVSGIGDVAVGNTRMIPLQFPSTVGAAGSNGTLIVTAQNALGQTITCPSLRVTLP